MYSLCIFIVKSEVCNEKRLADSLWGVHCPLPQARGMGSRQKLAIWPTKIDLTSCNVERIENSYNANVWLVTQLAIIRIVQMYDFQGQVGCILRFRGKLIRSWSIFMRIVCYSILRWIFGFEMNVEFAPFINLQDWMRVSFIRGSILFRRRNSDNMYSTIKDNFKR